MSLWHDLDLIKATSNLQLKEQEKASVTDYLAYLFTFRSKNIIYFINL